MSLSALQISRLSGRLHSAYVRTRLQGGVELSYIEGWHAIAEANRIFGFDGWNRETLSLTCLSAKPQGGRTVVSYLARVRITVMAGERSIIREGTGVGHGTAETLGQAHELAAKSAETDATKRALATFGTKFGLKLAAGHQAARRQGISHPLLNDPPPPARENVFPAEPFHNCGSTPDA